MAERYQELLTLRQYAVHRGCGFRQAKPEQPYGGVSYVANKPVELVQILVVDAPKEQQPTLKINKQKTDALVAAAQRYQLRAVLVVNWQGDINWIDLSEVAEACHPDEPLFPEATVQRRGNQEKEERVYCVDILLFRVLGTHDYTLADGRTISAREGALAQNLC